MSSDVLSVVRRSRWFAGSGEESAPCSAGFSRPYPHPRGDADDEGQEEPEKGEFKTGGPVNRAGYAVLRRSAVERGEEGEGSPPRSHR